MSRRWLIPEVIQTSQMDCGPAALKALLEGFGQHASYGRLREACHTDVDGTSIDTIEEIANRLGLEAAQMMVPLDHLVLDEGAALPCMVVTQIEGSGNHFVVVWRRHGGWFQVMDPGVGRRWVRVNRFLQDVYLHQQKLPADAWLEWAKGPGFVAPLRARMRKAGVSAARTDALIQAALGAADWRPLAALDAAVHLAQTLHSPVLAELALKPGLIPSDLWSVEDAGEGGILFRGAVIMHCSGAKATDLEALPESLRGALNERAAGAAGELWKVLREGGISLPLAALGAALASSAAVIGEALLMRALFGLGAHLNRTGERFAAIGALVLFLASVALIEWAMEDLLRANGRELELRLRTRFCIKIPRLGDRYFQSRLIADMAQRAHGVQLLRGAPPLAANLLRSAGALTATVGGIIWFFPQAAVQAVLCGLVSAAIPMLAQPWLLERDLRFREYGGALSRFYLDALLGIVPIRTHGAGPALRATQNIQLARWASAGLRMVRSQVILETFQMFLSYGLAAWLVYSAMQLQANAAALLLLVYWSLSLPEMGRAVSAAAWQWPGLRNGLSRLLEPLGAPEQAIDESAADVPEANGGVRIQMQQLECGVAGHSILRGIDLTIEPGQHVGIVGLSGAGKSSLVGLLLGWYQVSSGVLEVDGETLTAEGLHRLRRQTAWVDPQVQLWNKSLVDNLRYGLPAEWPLEAARAIEAANLGTVIQNLPGGMTTAIGEGGALLSGGERQRVRMARAYGKPGVRLAILDEPARGLDRNMRAEFAERARAIWKDATMLFITHDVLSTRGFSRVLVMEGGRVLEDGHPDELYARQDSRYRQLCDREAHVRESLWNAVAWRRLRVEGGRLHER